MSRDLEEIVIFYTAMPERTREQRSAVSISDSSACQPLLQTSMSTRLLKGTQSLLALEGLVFQCSLGWSSV